MLAFIQSQPGIVDKLLLHVETPSFIDLLGRIIQLDEHIPDCNVLEVRCRAYCPSLAPVDVFVPSGYHLKTLWDG